MEAPLENLPLLYQIWRTLEVLISLLAVTEMLGYQIKQQQLARRDIYGVYIQLLPDGKTVLTLEHPIRHTIIKFIPERTYGRQKVNNNHHAFHSISVEQRPDVAVEIFTPGYLPRIYLFDPKYKLIGEESDGNGIPKKEDIDKMHAYRDAIRDKEQRRTLQYAAILYPGKQQSYRRWH